jgi:hypothetical protein
MAQTLPNEGRDNNGDAQSLSEKLKQESERLRELAEQLQAREKALAEMEANYPTFKAMAYAWMKEKALAEVPPLPDGIDLEDWAKAEGGKPLEDFIDEL